MRTRFRPAHGPFAPGPFDDPGAEFGHHGFPPRPPMPPGPPGMPFDFGGWGWGQQRRGRGPGRRSRRGDVRAAILALLAERPMHGYEMIQEITQRSGGIWRPSPGSVYPTLQLLADEGLVASTEGSGSKRLFELTDEGRTAAEGQDRPPWEQIAQDQDPDDVSLRTAIGQLMGAAFQVHHAATGTQKTRAIAAINQARREIYAILGEIDDPSDEPDEPDED
ncbi:PadR family transcriptional regulator [Actinophytocola sp.]|uniref:PadR family transcriptional regulator n=1 Tax=Actinophytocola sp. TaxID=1872138 RepID=UPI002D7E2447|nr:PadR family transcriptional regulator [Actinophytocola sp.]HET9143555.1 PadR family transcriptional regulator [Actinophytocola sp.]